MHKKDYTTNTSKVYMRVHYQMGQSDCLVKIKNIVINAGVDNQVF